MKGDVPIRCAYGTALAIAITVKSLAGAPVNVTGYTARMVIQRFNDCDAWTTVMSLTSAAGQIAIGGANGVITATVSGANATALGAYFGAPEPNRSGRYEIYATPPAGTEVPILAGEMELLAAGKAVSSVSADVYQTSFSVTVSAIVPAGPEGPEGPPGPIVPATYVSDGAMTAGDKRAHDATTALVVNANGAPWNLKGDNTDESVPIAALAAYLLTISPTPGAVVMFKAGKYRGFVGFRVPQFISLEGAGYGTELIRPASAGCGPVVCHIAATLDAPQASESYVRKLKLTNEAVSDSIAVWAPGASFTVGQIVRTADPSPCALKLLSKSGNTGPYAPVGELTPTATAPAMFLRGTANADHRTWVKVITGGPLGVMTFQVSTNGGSSYGATQTSVYDPIGYTYTIPGFGGLAVYMPSYPTGAYLANAVIKPIPRVEVIGTPLGANTIVDVQTGSVKGPLGTMKYYVLYTSNTEKWKYGLTGGAFGAQQTSVGGAAYHDYTIPASDGLVVRFHAGDYSEYHDYTYNSPAATWSMVPGTTVQDGGHLWEIQPVAACSVIGMGTITYDHVAMQGGNCNVVLNQAEAVTLRDCSYRGAQLAGAWLTNGGELTPGANGEFTNTVNFEGRQVWFSETGWGIIHDGGFGLGVSGGACVFQRCRAGWIYIAGARATRLDNLYEENSRGMTRNVCYTSRRGLSLGFNALGIYNCNLIGSTGGAYCFDFYAGECLVAEGNIVTGTVGFNGLGGIINYRLIANKNLNPALAVTDQVGTGDDGYSFVSSNVSTPAALTANANDLGVAGYDYYRLSSDSTPRTVTGFARGNRRIVVTNINTATPMHFAADNAGSAAGNRLLTAFTLQPGETAPLYYDPTSQRWRCEEAMLRPVHTLQWRSRNIAADGFLAAGGADNSAPNTASQLNGVIGPLPVGTLKLGKASLGNFAGTTSAANSVFTLYVISNTHGQVSTGITCTIAAGASDASDNTHEYVTADGDFAYVYATGASANVTFPTFTVQFVPR